jgi:hypothetical protein
VPGADDEVDLWLEIPRAVASVAAPVVE